MVVLIWSLVPLGTACGLDGLWVLQGPGPETVYRFLTLDSGEMVAEVVHRTGTDETTRYFCKNQQFSGLPLLHHPWIRGLRPSGPGRWSGGLAVDLRNDHGNLFYCDLVLVEEGSGSPQDGASLGGSSLRGPRLLLQSVSGLADEDRTQVLLPWAPPEASAQPDPTPLGNLMESLWAESPEVVAARERAKPRPILSPTADAIVGGFFLYGAVGVILLLTALVLLSQ